MLDTNLNKLKRQGLLDPLDKEKGDKDKKGAKDKKLAGGMGFDKGQDLLKPSEKREMSTLEKALKLLKSMKGGAAIAAQIQSGQVKPVWENTATAVSFATSHGATSMTLSRIRFVGRYRLLAQAILDEWRRLNEPPKEKKTKEQAAKEQEEAKQIAQGAENL